MTEHHQPTHWIEAGRTAAGFGPHVDWYGNDHGPALILDEDVTVAVYGTPDEIRHLLVEALDAVGGDPVRAAALRAVDRWEDGDLAAAIRELADALAREGRR